jgi:sugar lactone lactonase YvrE
MKRRSVLWCTTLLSSLFAAACSTDPQKGQFNPALWEVDGGSGRYDDHSDSDDNIDHNVVVSLARTADGASVCTGVLISPRLVLTAATCLLDGKAGTTPFVRIGAASPFRQTTSAGNVITFAATPTNEPSLSGQDLALIVLKDFVLETGRSHHPSLIAPQSVGTAEPNGLRTFANVVLAGWSGLDSGGQPLPFAQTNRQLLIEPTLELWPYAAISPRNEPFWVIKPYTDAGVPKLGLSSGDSGAPLFTVVNGAWSLMGIASIIGDPPDPALRGQPLPALSACAPISTGTSSSCDAWVDVTGSAARSWILANAQDNTRTAHWHQMHPPLSTTGNDSLLWIGDVDYQGVCDTVNDLDCDHVYNKNSDGTNRDNCPDVYNPDQIDSKDSGRGDACPQDFTHLAQLAGNLGGRGNLDGSAAQARFGISCGMALDDTAGALFVSDCRQGTIRQIGLATQTVTTLSTGLVSPTGLLSDGAGHLYVAEPGPSSGFIVQKLDTATGTLTTVADGSAVVPGQRGLSEGSIAADGNGNLYIADGSNNVVWKAVIATGTVSVFAGAVGAQGSADGVGTAARFADPTAIACDGVGNLFIADVGNETIRRIALANANVTTLAGKAGNGFVDGIGTAAGFAFPAGLIYDGAGHLFVADDGARVIRFVDIATTNVTTWAASGAPRFDHTPTPLAVDKSGNVYVSDDRTFNIRKVRSGLKDSLIFAGPPDSTGSSDGIGAAAHFHGPTGVASDQGGNIYIADSQNWTIRKVVPSTGQVSTIAGLVGSQGTADGIGSNARFQWPTDLVADTNGNLFVGDGFAIRKVVIATGQVSTLVGSPSTSGNADGVGTAARFSGTPQSITSDPAGNLFVIDSGRVRQVVIATRNVTTLSNVQLALNGHAAFAFDGNGNIYIADNRPDIWNYPSIRKVVLATGAVTPVLTNSEFDPGNASVMAFDGTDTLYLAGENLLRKVSISNAAATVVAGSTSTFGVSPGQLPGSLNNPSGIAFLPNGDLAITDENAVLLIY